MKIEVAKVFSKTPGARSPDEGAYSGEEFLASILGPAFEESVQRKEKLIVDLDGTEGYATSFLEASFGGLARRYGINDVISVLVLVSKEEPYLVEEIVRYVRQAADS